MSHISVNKLSRHEVQSMNKWEKTGGKEDIQKRKEEAAGLTVLQKFPKEKTGNSRNPCNESISLQWSSCLRKYRNKMGSKHI